MFPRLTHQILEKMNIVNAQKRRAQKFSRNEQMSQIRARERAASVIIEPFDERAFVKFEFFVFNVNRSKRRERGPVARQTRWHHTIEHIRAERNHF